MSVTLESKNRIAALTAAAKATAGGDAGNLTEAVQTLCDAFVGLIDGTITEISSDKVNAVGNHAFYNASSLIQVCFPNAASIGLYAFGGCTLLESIDFPKATSIGNNAFRGCTALGNMNLPLVENIGSGAVLGNQALKAIDLPRIKSIGNLAFQGNIYLESLIIRTPEICVADTNILSSAGMYTDAGFTYIYVPASLIEEYKLATNWVKYAAQFRALEDYTVDGTTTGALDLSKI